MSESRPYRSAARAAAAARTREVILTSAKVLFETRTWAGTTIPMVAEKAGVSVSSVEAIYKTKAALLNAVVDFSIRGDVGEETMDRREVFAQIREAPDAPTMLARHAVYVRTINQRAATIGWVVEHAAHHDQAVAELWRQMNHNRGFGADAAAEALMTKPGIRIDLVHAEAANVFWLAIDWSTYRSLTVYRGLTPQAFQEWIHQYYTRQLL